MRFYRSKNIILLGILNCVAGLFYHSSKENTIFNFPRLSAKIAAERGLFDGHGHFGLLHLHGWTGKEAKPKARGRREWRSRRMIPICSAKHRQDGASAIIKKSSPTLSCSTFWITATKSTLFDRTKTTNTSVYYNRAQPIQIFQ